MNGGEANAPAKQQQIVVVVHVHARSKGPIDGHQERSPPEASTSAAAVVAGWPSEELIDGAVRL